MIYLCPHCFEEPQLKKRIEEIRPRFPNRKCTFHPRLKGVPLASVATIVDHVFRNNYRLAGYRAELDYGEGGDLLYTVCELTFPVSDEIAEVLIAQFIENGEYSPSEEGDPFYARDQSYVRDEPNGYHHGELWRNFCDSIVHGQRFFNTRAVELIADIFEGVHQQRDHYKRDIVYPLLPGEEESVFFRARIVGGEEDRRHILTDPARHLGPPPKRKRRPGRMNPAGIMTFYGAFDLDTCVAELRPTVGSRIVGGQFALVRPVYVLDTTRFQGPPRDISPFARDHLRRVEQWRFMQDFMWKIAQPVSPNDEYLDYIPTQAVAEYLLHHHAFKRRNRPERIEGLIYRSAQHPKGRNIVLLGDAAHVVLDGNESAKPEKRKNLSQLFSETITDFLDERRTPVNPALRHVEGSATTLAVQSAHYHTETEEHDEELDF